MRSLTIGLEALLLVSALSLDAFAASFAYGTNKITIPFKSVSTINIICSAILGIALLLGRLISQFIPANVTSYISFTILFLIAAAKLFDFAIKTWIKKSSLASPQLDFHFLNFHFLLQVMCDPTQADVDASKTLSLNESAALALALSLDGLAAGFGAGLVEVNVWIMVLFSLITNMIAISLGCLIGNKIAAKTTLNLSWLSGVVLLIIAFTKL